MTHEVVIIGGGLAGSAAAIHLSRAGHSVVLIEREAGPKHKVCGEFLSQEALKSLQALGIEPTALGAVSLEGVRLVGAGSPTSAALPFPAMSLTRRTLDEALLQLAAASGANLIRGVRVQDLQRDGEAGWAATLDNGDTLRAPTVFLATGKHDLAGRLRPVGVHSGLVGFKMYFKLAKAQGFELGRYVELLTYPGGYGGLQPVEDGAANLCCLIERRMLQRLGGGWQNLLEHMQQHCPHLGRRLQDAQPLLDRALAISPIPYGYVRSQTDTDSGLWALGDQAAVIPSFTGDGMSIALHSAALAAALYIEGETSNAFQTRLKKELRVQVRLATCLSRVLVWAPARWLMTASVSLWPGALRIVASRTRIDPAARLT